MIIQQTPVFAKQKKKLHSNQIIELDKAIKKIAINPQIGKKKLGDLSSIYVYKFKIVKQNILLAYQIHNHYLLLISLGSHENFYRDLKKILK